MDKAVSILGVPLGYGASMAGVDIGPAALRVARLNQRIARLGYSVEDRGDMRLERPRTFPEEGEKLKYVREISNACEHLAVEVESILAAGHLPLVLGGDHSIAVGTVSGMSEAFRRQKKTLGLIWFDASLFDSRLLVYTLGGYMVMLMLLLPRRSTSAVAVGAHAG